MILSVNGLSFSYRSAPVLAEVTFQVAPGEMLVLLGPNGVGKSTLLKCLNNIHAPASGTVRIKDRDIRELSPSAVARRVGYVAQRHDVGRMTVFDAVLLGRKPYIRWKATARDLEIVEAAVRRLGLARLALRHLDEMSGGEQQKVSIARALVQEPDILLLDEPTSSLDLFNQMEILTFLRHVARDHGMAVVMSLHDLNQALRFGDRFLFLKNGMIHAAVARDEVSEQIIEEVYGLPVTMGEVDGVPMVMPRRGAMRPPESESRRTIQPQ